VPVKPELPSNLWYDENNLRQPSEPGAPVVSSEQAIQLMLKALNELEVRGFGQQTVTTLHASGVCTKIADYFWVTEAALAQALGSQKIAANLAGQLQAAIQRLTPAHLLTIASAPDGQRAFGRGMGYKKFASLLQQYPNFLQDVLDTETEPSLLTRRIHTKLLPVEGFGPKTLELVLNGLDAFREWFASLPPTIQAAAVAANSTTSPATAPIAVVAVLRKVCVTGLRKDDVSALERAIAPHGGSIQHQVNGSTTMVVRLDEQYTSNKVTAAVAKGLPLLTLAQFREQYLKT
jgi:NAD-dependent DNA ligase